MNLNLKRTIKFALFGLAAGLTYVGLYLALIAAGIAGFFANALAFFQVIALSIACKSAFDIPWTLNGTRQIVRFAAMICLAFGAAALITGPIAGWTEMLDWKAAVLAIMLVALQSAALLKAWVFEEPLLVDARTTA